MTTIKFWLMPNAGFESKLTIDRELELFHKVYPGIHVEYEILSWSRAWAKLIQAVKEKSGPDIMQVGTTWIGTLGYLGAVQKLDAKKIDAESFNPLLFNMCKSFRHLWAIPWFGEARVLFYRKDFFEKTEIDLSSIDRWESFTHACTKLSKLHTHTHQITPLGFSGYKEQAILQDLASWIWSHGGDFLSHDGKHSAINHPGAKEGLKTFLDLISCGHISKLSLGQSSGEVAENFFFHDAYAFYFSSSWPLQVYLDPSSKHYIGKNKAKNFGIAPVPSGPTGKFNFAGGSALAVSSFTNHPEEAWSFLEFMTSPESMARYCQNINMLPSRRDVSVVLNQIEGTKEVFDKAIDDLGRSFPSHPLWGSIEQILVNGIAHSLRDYQSNFDQEMFMTNLSEINQEIELILSVFGE